MSGDSSNIIALKSISEKLRESTAKNNLPEIKNLLLAANRLTSSTSSTARYLNSTQQNLPFKEIKDPTLDEEEEWKKAIEDLYKEQIKQLKRERDVLQERAKEIQEKFISTIQLTDKLLVFACRMQLTFNDLHKIDFLQCEVQLLWDTLLIRNGETILQRLDMGELTEVIYGEEVMLIRFGEINLFLKTRDERWDEMLFKAYHFASMKQRPQTQKYFQKKPVNYTLLDESDLLKMLIGKRDEYLAVKRIMDERVAAKKSNKQQLLQIMRPPLLKAASKNQSPSVQTQQQRDVPQQSKDMQNSEKQRIRVEEQQANKKKQQELEEQKLKEEKISKEKLENQKKTRKKNACISLQHGYFFTKYSKDGFFPHEKKVFLSIDETRLCWADPKKTSDYKYVELSSILQITYMKIGEGVKKHVEERDPALFCTIQYTTEGKQKLIQLGCKESQSIKAFSTELQILLNYKKEQKQGKLYHN